MSHSLTGLGSASLDTQGGLVTLAPAIDLPEGASPRTWDTDFAVGAVRSRDGLSSFYSYASTLSITGFVLVYGIATFTYVGTPEPTINEGFRLSGFTGNQAYLNGLEIFVESAGMTTFTAAIASVDDGPISGLNASAVSTTGNFVGPNQGSNNTSTTWLNPQNITSVTAYASATSSANLTATITPTSATNR